MLTAGPGEIAVQVAPPGTVRDPRTETETITTTQPITVTESISATQSLTATIAALVNSRRHTITLPLVEVGESDPVTVTEPAAPAPALAWDGQPRTVRLPVLMYHYLSAPPADANNYRLDLSVTPELFARHLDRIQAEGYTTISLYELQAHLWQGAPLPEKAVAITFDDGYRDNYTNAFPLLRERGMTATIFVVTDFMDEERPEYMTWDMAREMLAAGISIESHGRNHMSLKNRDDDYLVWQALGSLETIAAELGVRPRFVSYPAGEFDQRTIDIFASAHYWAGFTTIQGATHSTDEPFRMHRVRVRGTTEPDELIRLLELDW